jgi:NAD-dependent dihydropyrimidine dehydrogenase PreA subunit
MAFLMGMLGYQITRLWPDWLAIGAFFMLLLTITTAVGIMLALFVHQRSWCCICPIGTMSNWVGKNRGPLGLNHDACVECGLCEKVCPMQLSPVQLKDEEGIPPRRLPQVWTLCRLMRKGRTRYYFPNTSLNAMMNSSPPKMRLSRTSGILTAHFAPIKPPSRNPAQMSAAALRLTSPC